jgi:hypothetical protein
VPTLLQAFYLGYRLFLMEMAPPSAPSRYFLELDFDWALPRPLVVQAFDDVLHVILKVSIGPRALACV